MSTNPPILLLDTNVWLDCYLPHRPNQAVVKALLAEATAQEASLVYASHALLDVFQRIRTDNKRWIRATRPLTELDALAIKRMAWDLVNEMRGMATAVPVTVSDIDLACHFRDQHDDLEDDLVLAACQRAHANYLVTSDTTLLQHAPIEAKTPKEMLELLRSGRARGTVVSRATTGNDWLYRWLETYGTGRSQDAPHKPSHPAGA